MSQVFAETPEPAPFEAIEPAGPFGPLVFASPHSGDHYPADMGADPALGETSLRSAEDALVDRLIAPAGRHGVPRLLGRIGRAYVDLNRDPADLDPQLVADLAPDSGTARSVAGYGVAPRLSGDGRPLYARRLSRAEVEARLAWAHAPYHAALDGLLARARARHGRAVLIDWHSMPARATGGRRGAEVVLGDRHGSSASAEVTRAVRQAFEALGWRVALNAPYAGGWTTQRCGRPDEGIDAVQVELSRALYLDETTGREGRGYARCAKGVAQVIARLAQRWPA